MRQIDLLKMDHLNYWSFETFWSPSPSSSTLRTFLEGFVETHYCTVLLWSVQVPLNPQHLLFVDGCLGCLTTAIIIRAAGNSTKWSAISCDGCIGTHLSIALSIHLSRSRLHPKMHSHQIIAILISKPKGREELWWNNGVPKTSCSYELWCWYEKRRSYETVCWDLRLLYLRTASRAHGGI